MGYYINPDDREKEAWLQEHGEETTCEEISATYQWGDKSLTVPVCWLDNGLFTAAGVAYDRREFGVFVRGRYNRPWAWYMVPKDKLIELHPLMARVLEQGSREQVM